MSFVVFVSPKWTNAAASDEKEMFTNVTDNIRLKATIRNLFDYQRGWEIFVFQNTRNCISHKALTEDFY